MTFIRALTGNYWLEFMHDGSRFWKPAMILFCRKPDETDCFGARLRKARAELSRRRAR